jgi:hypothetical protein
MKIEKQIDSALEACDGIVQSHVPSPEQPSSSDSLPGEQPSSSDPLPGEQPSSSDPLPGEQPSTTRRPSPPAEPPCSKPPSREQPSITESPAEPQPTATSKMTPGQCARILRQLCPACFGGTSFGASFDDGGDFHNCVDGNFHHRHLKSAGECAPFYDPKQIIPKEFVDRVGDRIARARKSPPRPRKSKVPDEAVDECEKAHKAANGDKETATSERFDANGLMALVCRHDIPLFFANIDTPGEQQKYAIALIEYFFSLIPPQATVVNLYDISCVADCSINLV